MNNFSGFLEGAGWADAVHYPLAQDASARRYVRLVQPSGSAILMIDPEGNVVRFASLSRYLNDAGLSAPVILSEDLEKGLLLLEDFGDDVFAQLVQQAPESERLLYETAADALNELHLQPVPAALSPVSVREFAEMTGLAFDCYAKWSGHPVPDDIVQSILTALEASLDQNAAQMDVVILRDFHAENLIWLPERTGAARVGLLDFQDAMRGHKAYDLVSLLQDARRDVTPETVVAAKHRFLDNSGMAAGLLEPAYAVLGAQRQLRILGIFARLARLRAKPHYIDLIPRVWGHLQTCLAHPALSGVAPLLERHLPTPTPGILERLRLPCPKP